MLTEALNLVWEVNQSNNSSMSTQLQTTRKKQLQKLFGKNVNLMQPKTVLIEEVRWLYMVEPNSKDRKDVIVFLFSDCLVVAIDYF